MRLGARPLYSARPPSVRHIECSACPMPLYAVPAISASCSLVRTRSSGYVVTIWTKPAREPATAFSPNVSEASAPPRPASAAPSRRPDSAASLKVSLSENLSAYTGITRRQFAPLPLYRPAGPCFTRMSFSMAPAPASAPPVDAARMPPVCRSTFRRSSGATEVFVMQPDMAPAHTCRRAFEAWTPSLRVEDDVEAPPPPRDAAAPTRASIAAGGTQR
mmetsp:Transcript_16385/g.55777  ORF Transcript_16385/g.55777 Transcript_16385/m.55777 type:complete len:218 (+) Transcript_16385:265-918(+)